MVKTVFPPPKVLDPKIAPTQKLPLQTGLPGLGYWRLQFIKALKHWGSMVSFLWGLVEPKQHGTGLAGPPGALGTGQVLSLIHI